MDRREGHADQRHPDGPALKGATNQMLPQRDHREVSFHPQAFALTYTFIAGEPAGTLDVAGEAAPVLDGVLSGIGPAGPDNRPLVGATLEVYAVDAASGARLGEARHRKTIGADGRWGPFIGRPTTAYEFVVSAPGYAVTHIYRSPFPRSSASSTCAPNVSRPPTSTAVSVISFTRPRGYFGLPRDRITLDGVSPPPASPVAWPACPASSSSSTAGRAVRWWRSYESGPIRERIVGRAWPAAQDHLVVLELTN